MESWQALRMAVGGHAVRVAKALGLSSSMVHKWCEASSDFSDSGALNPVDRTETIIETALREGQSPSDALAPIFYLANRFDCLLLPPIPRTCATAAYSKQLCVAVKEAGEAFATAAKALEDDCLSPNERRKIARDMYEAISALSQFARMVEEK